MCLTQPTPPLHSSALLPDLVIPCGGLSFEGKRTQAMFFMGPCGLASKKIHKSLISVLAEECFPQIGTATMVRALHNLV